MNPNERMMLHLLDCALYSKAPDAALAEGTDWTTLFQLAQEHKIDALLLDPICMLPPGAQPQGDVMAAWQENAMLTMMGQALLTDQLHQLLDAYEAAGIKAVVFKGVSLKSLYPQPDLRTMSDADLLVSRDDIAPARALIEAQGYAFTQEEPGVFIYTGPDGLRVELHAYLFDTKEYGFLSRLDEQAMFPISLAAKGPVYGGEAWIYPPMEHAVYMLCHMAGHMITTGFGLRQLADFVLFVQAYDNEIDWDAFWQLVKTLGLVPFASALLALGGEYLSLPGGGWAKGAATDPKAAQALLMDLLDAGVFGKRTEKRVVSAGIVNRAFDEEDASAGRIRRVLFPSANSLKAPYLYARRHPVLLPAAWVHRWFHYAYLLLTGKKSYADTAAGVDVANDRLALLDQLGFTQDRDH